MVFFYVGDDRECQEFLVGIPSLAVTLIAATQEEDIFLHIKNVRPALVFCDLGIAWSGGKDLLIKLRTDPETEAQLIIADLGSVKLYGHGLIEGTDVSGPDLVVTKPYDYVFLERIIKWIFSQGT